jgi:hypothetical protein
VTDQLGSLIAWDERTSSSDLHISARLYDSAGNPMGPQFQVNSSLLGNPYNVDISQREKGARLAVWQSQDGSEIDTDGSFIQGRHISTAGTPSGSDFLINTLTAGDQERPQVESLPSGGYAVVWQSDEPALDEKGSLEQDIYLRLIGADGVPLGQETRINAITAGSQFDPSISVDRKGNILVTWTSTASDGSDQDGFGVRGRLLRDVHQLAQLRIVSPTQGGVLRVGDSVQLEWDSTNLGSTEPIEISIRRDAVVGDVPDGVNWHTFEVDSANDGTETVTLPNTLAPATDWRFYVRYRQSGVYRATDFTFTIVGTTIFIDSFESGNVDAWTAVGP